MIYYCLSVYIYIQYNCILLFISFPSADLPYKFQKVEADFDLVYSAVSANGRALCFAASDLRSDRQVALAAVRSCAGAMAYVGATVVCHHVRCIVDEMGYVKCRSHVLRTTVQPFCMTCELRGR